MLAIALLWIAGYQWATTIIKVKIEIVLISIGVFFTGLVVLYQLNAARIKRITKKQKDELFSKSNEEHKRFIQRLDHELKNPLTAMQLGLANLKLQHKGESTKIIDDLQTQTRRLSQLTGDLRKLAIFDEQELELERVDIADLLSETTEFINDTEHHRKVELTLPAAPWPVPNIMADRDLLQLAIYNVIENAVKYSNKNDHIAIRASDNKEIVNIEIADTGIGISAADIGEVWGELFRGSNGHDRKGTGIGLSLVKRIIERHHGKIDIQSKLNTGTRVIFTLPISK